ncbi:unnamed protein product [Aphanomyces euteiches]
MSRPTTTSAADEASLERKFVKINDEFGQVKVRGTDDAVKLQSKMNEWRDDVGTLATHIASQLQLCKDLRTSKAMALLPNVGSTPDNNPKEDQDVYRRLRSDIRTLYSYRLTYTDTSIEFEEPDALHLKEILNAPLVDKDSDTAYETLLRYIHAKTELMAQIAQDFTARKKQMDLDRGVEEEMCIFDDSAALLLSRDTKHLTKLVDACESLLKEVKAKSAPTKYEAAFVSVENDAATKSGLVAGRMDEANFSIQKLQREINELKVQKAKLAATNSQLEDNFAHIQAQYDLEKKTHQANVKWYEPRIHKLEEALRVSEKSLTELRLNVDLITNMYKKTCDDVIEVEHRHSAVAEERTLLGQKLHEEIKKQSILNLELERKDKLVMYAMGARHEVIKCWKETQAALAEMTAQKDDLAEALKRAQEERTLVELKLDESNQTRRRHEEDLRVQLNVVETLRANINEMSDTHHKQVAELNRQHEAELEAVQAKLDKTKKELVETVQDNIILDGKLRAAHDRIARFMS